jgi:predicted phosphohydrolase
MDVWAISDLHLSFARPDRRERYAARWRDHAARIEENWRARVGQGDLVLLPGDLSMARNHREVQPDLAWLERLPGTKVLAPGNHDQWWNSAAAVRRMLPASLRAVDGDALDIHGAIVCGTAGVPASFEPTSSEERQDADRAYSALGQALQAAEQRRVGAEAPLYVLWHYPPFDAHGQPGRCVELLERARVTACVYGHLHSQKEWSAAVQGPRNGVSYYCVAADAIGFCPLSIDEVASR